MKYNCNNKFNFNSHKILNISYRILILFIKIDIIKIKLSIVEDIMNEIHKGRG